MNWLDKLKQRLNTKPQFHSAEEVERAIGFDRIRREVWKLLDRMDMMTGAYTYLLDVYFDEPGMSLYAVLSSEALLYRAPLTIVNDRDVVMGDLQPIVDFSTASTERGVTRVFRQPDGRYRWFSISATAFLNRVGEIDSTSLFDSFVAYANRTGNFPYRTFYHQGEALLTGQGDFLARDGYCYITSGLFDEDSELALIEIAALQNNPTGWGESIGYVPTAEPVLMEVSRGITIPVYQRGIHVEISTVMERDAASWFTVPHVTKERQMDKAILEKLTALARDAGLSDEDQEEVLTQFATRVDGTNQRAQEPGAVARANTGTPDPEAAPEPDADVPAADEQEPIVVGDSVIAAVAEQVLGSEQFQALVGRAQPAAEVDLSPVVSRLDEMETNININFSNLDERLSHLEGEEEVRAEDMPVVPRTVVYRPSEGAQTVTRRPTNGIFEESSDDLVAGGLSKLDGMK
jgi:hypothetical protein